ncbi:MAG: hypothetical protein JXP73_07705 [Deltaproteobacteria bacterium]|jgi:hypothetical protein|nr:hypothetical protein [Deltaproteobacteria bacterium]
MGTETKLTSARLQTYVGVSLAALCPVFNLVSWPFLRASLSLLAVFTGSALVTLLALVGLVKSTRWRSGLLAALVAFVALIASVPSVLAVVVRITIRVSQFGEMLGSIAEGGADSAGASVLILATAAPIALVIAPVPILLLYAFTRREARLLKQLAPTRT